jgi:hypothetical protein
MVKARKLAGFLNGAHILGFFHHAYTGGVAAGIVAYIAYFSL